MKHILFFSMLFSVIVLPALCQTPQSSVETDIAVIKTEIKNLKESINHGFSNVQQDFDAVQKNFDRQNNIIIACIGIPLAILAGCATVWGILANSRRRKDQTLEKQIEVLTQEIETLKQQRIVNP